MPGCDPKGPGRVDREEDVTNIAQPLEKRKCNYHSIAVECHSIACSVMIPDQNAVSNY